MNEIRERLRRLGDAGAEGIELTRPSAVPSTPRRVWRTPALASAAVVVLVMIATGALIIGRGDGGDTNVETGEGPVDFTPAAVVAVTYGFASEVVTTPDDLTLRFLDTHRQMFAERSWEEAYEPDPGGTGGVTVLGGLLQDVPAGDLRLEATLQANEGPVSCSQPFTAAAGDRLILHLELEGPADVGATRCAAIETVDQWVAGGTSGPLGQQFRGLTPSEAEDRANAEDRTTRVVAEDGMVRASTADLDCDRIDLMVFDGVVVAANMPQELWPTQCGDDASIGEPAGG